MLFDLLEGIYIIYKISLLDSNVFVPKSFPVTITKKDPLKILAKKEIRYDQKIM